MNAVVAQIKYCSVLLGFIKEVLDKDDLTACAKIQSHVIPAPQIECSDIANINVECPAEVVSKLSDDAVAQAITRSTKPALHPLIVPSLEPIHIKRMIL